MVVPFENTSNVCHFLFTYVLFICLVIYGASKITLMSGTENEVKHWKITLAFV